MKRSFLVLLAALLFLLPVIPSRAQAVEADLEMLETQKDVVFWVSWDVEEPEIVFLAPDGTVYDPKVQGENTTTVQADKSLYYVVKQAPAGQWRIRYDKGKNTTIDVSVHDYNAGVYIESFTIGAVEGDRLPVSFKVGGQENRSYSYRISAMIDHTGVEKELSEGYASVGNAVERTVYLSSLASYDKYMLKLYVWYDDNGTDIFDFMFSETFAYTNTKADERVTDFVMTVLPEDHLVEVAWPDAGWSTESVLVAIFENDDIEPAAFDEYKTAEYKSVQLAYDPTATKVSVEVTPKQNGVSGGTTRKEAVLSEFALSLPEGDAFASTVLPMTYKGLSKQEAAVTVNGYTTDLVLDGDGKLNITLGEDWNDLQILYTDARGVTWKIQRQIFVDGVAPVLTMSRSYDGMTVDAAKITVSGTVVDYATVTVNGEVVTPDESGAFSKEVKLANGENVITVIAADALGNESQYVAAVTRGFTGTEEVSDVADSSRFGGLLETLTGFGSYWVLLLVSVPCLLLIGYALLFWRKED